MSLQVELVSADQQVWAGEATMIVARTVEGELGVMPGHAPLLAMLASGEIRIHLASGDEVVADAQGGFLSVEHDRVTVVSDRAALASGPSTR